MSTKSTMRRMKAGLTSPSFLPSCLLLLFIYFALFHRSSHKENGSLPSLSSNRPRANDQFPYDEVEKNVFLPLGRRVSKKSLIPKLEFIEEPICENVFSEWLSISKNHDEGAAPPRNIPHQMLSNYTMNGYAGISIGYLDDRSGKGEMTWGNIDGLVNKDIASDSFNRYSGEGRGIYSAMRDHDLPGTTGFVVGSLFPYAEIFALKNGAKKVYTLEYKKINIIGSDRIVYRHPIQVAENYKSYVDLFDFAVSFSSIEHSGLGRFGDALDPIGDFREALKIRCMLKKNGLFFLGFPVGKDHVSWNLHRVYGRIRLALMFTGFDLVGTYYKMEEIVLKEHHLTRSPEYSQLVFALRKV